VKVDGFCWIVAPLRMFEFKDEMPPSLKVQQQQQEEGGKPIKSRSNSADDLIAQLKFPSSSTSLLHHNTDEKQADALDEAEGHFPCKGLSEEQATAIWQRHVRIHRCADVFQASNLAPSISRIVPHPVLIYTLDSYVESKWISWGYEKISDSDLVSINRRRGDSEVQAQNALLTLEHWQQKSLTGLAGRLLAMAKPDIFVDERIGIRIPGSQALIDCSACKGTGRIRCSVCKGTGNVTCMDCLNGYMLISPQAASAASRGGHLDDNQCAKCLNRRIVECSFCISHSGMAECQICFRMGKLRRFAMMNLEWRTATNTAFIASDLKQKSSHRLK
jgi:hypothetical protein